MSDKPREQIERVRRRGDALASAFTYARPIIEAGEWMTEAADTMEKMLAVVEAARTVFDNLSTLMPHGRKELGEALAALDKEQI